MCVDCKNMALFLNSLNADILETCLDEENGRHWHLLLAGRAPWCPQPRHRWWSHGTGPHTAADSTLHVLLAAAAAQDCRWWSGRRIVWGFQNALAAWRNRHLKSINKIKTSIGFLFHPQTITLSIVLSPHTIKLKANMTSVGRGNPVINYLEIFKWQWKLFCVLFKC